MRLGPAHAVVVIAALWSLSASANNGGVAGYTGKPSSAAPQGESCNQCHTGGTAPQVSITGPASLEGGKAAEYTLVVMTGQTRAAGAIAATDGVLLTPTASGGLRDSFGEMVQDGSRAVAGGQATFTFRVTAPTSGNTLRLWATGMAASGQGTGGDRSVSITRDIAVTGGLPPPAEDAGTPASSGGSSGAPGVDGGASSTTTGGGGVTGAGDEPSGSDPDDEDDGSGSGNETGGGADRRRAAGSQAGSCAASQLSGSRSIEIAAAMAIALALAGVRRSRRKHGARIP